MSLITRCPACGTLFRVVPDQLKISDGWVRCGQCNEIFDAQAALQISPPAVADAEPLHEEAFAATQFSPEAWPGEGPDAPEATVAVEPVDEPDLQWTIPMEPPGAELSMGVVESEPEPESKLEPEPEPEPEPEARSEPEPHDRPGRAPASFDAGDGHSPVEPFADTVLVLEEPGPIEPTLRDEPLAVSPPPLEDAPAASSDVVSPDTPAIPPAADPLEAAPEATPPVPLDRVSFVRQARRRAFWRRPVVRVLLLLVALLLGLALVIQVAIQERDRLALQVPALRPALELLCKPLQCQVGPPRRIEAIVIDSSAFSRLRPDAYRLAVTLSNRSALPVALPALELTLTDTQDQPVLRRVLRAPELGQAADGAAGGAIAANAEWSATLTITITPDANAARIAGYRLLAFYP